MGKEAPGPVLSDHIPRVIFQTWKSRTEIPENFASWRESFGKFNPGWPMVLWDDSDNRQFVLSHFPWFLTTYDSFPAEIYRADVIRYLYLYEYGGVYADMDTECLAPIAPLTESGADIILGRMGDSSFRHSIPNAIMISRKRQEFWLLVISIIMGLAHRRLRPEHMTGPVVLRLAVMMYTDESVRHVVQSKIRSLSEALQDEQAPREGPSKIELLPTWKLYPLDWNDAIHRHLVRDPIINRKQTLTAAQKAEYFPKSTFVTYWARSW